jgi:hypothetical protein
MNERTVKLGSVVQNLEQRKQTCNESDVVEQILNCIKSIRQNIERNKDSLR